MTEKNMTDRQKLQQFIPIWMLFKNAQPAPSSPVMHSWKPSNLVNLNLIEGSGSNETAMKNLNNRLSTSNSKSHARGVDAYPNIDQPVVFNFGNDYGTQMFRDFSEEFSRENSCNLAYAMPGFRDSLRSDVYKISSEEEMIKEFLKNKLFES